MCISNRSRIGWVAVLILLSGLPCAWAAEDAGLSAWLARPLTERIPSEPWPARPRGDRWLEAYLNLLSMPNANERIPETQALLRRRPPGRYPAYLRLELAAAWAADGQYERAIDVALAVRDDEAQGDARLRYEACRVLAQALTAAGRTTEAEACRRQAEDLAVRELYADPGVVAGASRQVAHDDLDPAQWYREAERLRLRGAWSEAATWYQRVREQAATHRLASASAVGLGWCALGGGDLTAAERWWRDLLTADPTGAFRAQALLALIDVALEERADPDTAERWLQQAEQRVAHDLPSDISWEELPREALLRRLILHLARNQTELARTLAMAWIDGPLHRDTPAHPAQVGTFVPAQGIAQFIERVTAGQPLTPAEALSSRHGSASLRVVLGDAWTALEVPERARRHFGKVAEPSAQAAPNQRIYAVMRLADLDRLAWEDDAFRAGYTRALAMAARHPWSAHIRLALAVDAYGRGGDDTSALAALDAVARDPSAGNHAQTALWYIATIHLMAGHWDRAEAAFTALDRRFPRHPWRDLVDTAYRPLIAEAKRTGTVPTAWRDIIAPPSSPSGGP